MQQLLVHPVNVYLGDMRVELLELKVKIVWCNDRSLLRKPARKPPFVVVQSLFPFVGQYGVRFVYLAETSFGKNIGRVLVGVKFMRQLPESLFDLFRSGLRTYF
nr:hypothetical protein [Taibaiella koreensis]